MLKVINGIQVLIVDRKSPGLKWDSEGCEKSECVYTTKNERTAIQILTVGFLLAVGTNLDFLRKNPLWVAWIIVGVVVMGLSLFGCRRRWTVKTWTRCEAEVRRIEIREVLGSSSSDEPRGDWRWRVRVECEMSDESGHLIKMIPHDFDVDFPSQALAIDAVFKCIRGGRIRLRHAPGNLRRIAIAWK
jgi:hypothetical protein